MNILAQQPLNNNNNNNEVDDLSISSIIEYLSELMGILNNQDDIKSVQDYSNNILEISTIAKIILKEFCDQNGNVHVSNSHNNDRVALINKHYASFQNLIFNHSTYSARVFTILQSHDKNQIADKFIKDLPLLTNEINNALSFLLTIKTMYNTN